VAGSSTRDALLEQGARLFARHGVDGVTARQLHVAIGARNESALHYHFGDRAGLALEIVRIHLAAVEARRAALVAAIIADDRTRDLPALVHALAAPMAEDVGSPLWALGFRNQVVAVIPSEDIVAVRMGAAPPPDAPFGHVELTTGVLDALVAP
jgi:AcrR family transcriptional regulator